LGRFFYNNPGSLTRYVQRYTEFENYLDICAHVPDCIVRQIWIIHTSIVYRYNKYYGQSKRYNWHLANVSI